MTATTKILVSGVPNSGKTCLLQPLEDVLVFSRDGKIYPFPQPHVNVPDFVYASELTTLMGEKICDYEDKFGKLPKTIVIDSISKILLDIEGETCKRVKSFPYGVVNTEIKALMDYIETVLAPNFNVVFVSHALFDAEADEFKLVNAGGSWGKKGGVISEVSEAVFIEAKGKKRTVHIKNAEMLSRTVIDSMPTKMTSDEFNLQKHINTILENQTVANTFRL